MKFLTIASCLVVGLSVQSMPAASAESSPASVSALQVPSDSATQKKKKIASVKKTHLNPRALRAQAPGPIPPGGALPPGPPPGGAPDGEPPGAGPSGLPPLPKSIGPLTPIGDALKAHGIETGVRIDNFSLHTINTGLVPNKTMNAGDVKYHVGLDLEQILGIPKTRINFDETEYMLSSNGFNFVFFSNSFFFPGAGGAKPTMLSRLTIESDIDRFHIEIGRMNPIFSFMNPLFCGACFNGTQARNAFFPGPDASAWGGRAAYTLSPTDTVQVGMFENDLYIFQQTNGWDFSTANAKGYIALANYMHETTFLTDDHPWKLELGAFHNSAPNTDPVYNTDGSSQVFNPFGTPRVHQEGITGGFAQVRKVIWSPEGSRGNFFAENVAVYGSLFVTPGSGISYPVEAITGIEWSNFIPGQPFWMIGAGLHYAMVGEQKALFEQQFRVLLGGPSVRTPQHMFDPTIVVRFPITPYIIAQPFAFYFINQDQSYIPAPTRQKDGFFVGARVTFLLGSLLGLDSGFPPK